MYMGKIPNTYEIILGASNFRNFIDRVQILKYIYQRFISLKNKIIEELDDVKKSINNIEKLKLKIQETKNTLEEQQANLKEKIKVLDKLYEESKQTQERIQCELDRENAEQAIKFGYNDAMKTFKKLDGNKYTFRKYDLINNYNKYNDLYEENLNIIFKDITNKFIKNHFHLYKV